MYIPQKSYWIIIISVILVYLHITIAFIIKKIYIFFLILGKV